ncbi:MAG TPA: FAD-linked oxidase C-terminal domain-containing protein, partial [Longimicrobiales bacterium]
QISAAEPQPLLELARYITTANLEAVALELLDAGALTESWLLLVRLAGNQESVADAHAHIAAHAKQLNAETRAAPAADWDALARLELSATTVVRLADLPSRLENTLQLAQRLMARVNGPCQMAAHAGDGVIRIFIGESTAADTAYVVGEIRELMAVSNGTVTLHSSNAELMRRVDAFGANNVPLALMSRLKQVFDPAGVLAPGRFVV